MERGEATLSNQKTNTNINIILMLILVDNISIIISIIFHGGDDDVGFLKRTNDILKLLKLIVEDWIMTNDD